MANPKRLELPRDVVLEIYRQRQAKVSATVVAQRFGVPRGVIYKISLGRIFTDITGAEPYRPTRTNAARLRYKHMSW